MTSDEMVLMAFTGGDEGRYWRWRWFVCGDVWGVVMSCDKLHNDNGYDDDGNNYDDGEDDNKDDEKDDDVFWRS